MFKACQFEHEKDEVKNASVYFFNVLFLLQNTTKNKGEIRGL